MTAPTLALGDQVQVAEGPYLGRRGTVVAITDGPRRNRGRVTVALVEPDRVRRVTTWRVAPVG